MSEMSFETALGARVEDMLDACTRCGKCVEVCPSVAPAGIADAASGEIISGIIEIVRTGEGPEASRKHYDRATNAHFRPDKPRVRPASH